MGKLSESERRKIIGRFTARGMSFIMEAVTLRELRGWPNEPVHNAAIIYEIYGWPFDEKDVRLIREDARARATPSGSSSVKP